MAKVSQALFTWQAIDESSDIFRLSLILESLNDQRLLERLRVRGPGRPHREPVEAMWNSLIAGVVCGHATIASLRRELARNAELRQVCGFDPIKRDAAVPHKDAYVRLLKKLEANQDALDEIFEQLLERLACQLPDFGRDLAVDGKAIVAERRSDPEAGIGVKSVGHPDGEVGEDAEREVTMSWFGYKLHMLSDARYELPIGFRVTAANEHESPHMKGLVDDAAGRHGEMMEHAETLAGDKGYDAGANKAWLFDEHGVAPVIPARATRGGAWEALDPQVHDTIHISDTGEVACRTHPFDTDETRQFTTMEFRGFEKNRGTLKFRCPAAAFGAECQNRSACRCKLTVRDGSYGRVVRVPLSRDPRRFTSIHQHSRRFERAYKRRTSVERLFYRLDHLYGFEHHQVRSLARARVRVAIALIAMQASALGWIESGQPSRMRSRRLAA